MARLGIVNLNASAIAIAVGREHTCAILAGGGVKCWGRSNHSSLSVTVADSFPLFSVTLSLVTNSYYF